MANSSSNSKTGKVAIVYPILKQQAIMESKTSKSYSKLAISKTRTVKHITGVKPIKSLRRMYSLTITGSNQKFKLYEKKLDAISAANVLVSNKRATKVIVK